MTTNLLQKCFEEAFWPINDVAHVSLTERETKTGKKKVTERDGGGGAPIGFGLLCFVEYVR